MFDFIFAPIGLGLIAYLLAPDAEQRIIEKAANGEKVGAHALAAAYWNKYCATHVPQSRWLTMSRGDKAKVLAKREELERFFVNFDVSLQLKVKSVRLRNVGALQSKRLAEQLLKIGDVGNDSVGVILHLNELYCFLQPRGKMLSYFVSSNDIAGGIKNLSVGDIVLFSLGENEKGLCARSVRKYMSP